MGNKIITILKTFGESINNIIISTILTIVYLLIISPYALFIKFNRKKIQRDYKYKKANGEKMF